jgi:putative Holliday junction resolvase
MARILGLDYGVKRTGISVTDPLQIIVNPLDVVETINLIDFLFEYIEKEDVEEIVIGELTHRDGREVYFEKEIKNLIKKINTKYPDINIVRQDESFTSSEAKDLLIQMNIKKKKRRDKSLLDKISSVLILQRYLKHI